MIKISDLLDGRWINQKTINQNAEIGKITEKTREVNINADKKRLWLESLTGINHKMNRSLPLSLNYFTKDEI